MIRIFWQRPPRPIPYRWLPRSLAFRKSLSPIVSVIPGQLLAMYLAERRRDGNLDQPRRLAKVTRTQ